MEYSIEFLSKAFRSLNWEDSKYKTPRNMIKNVEAITVGLEINNIYPKNLFVNDKDIEFYIFTDEYIFIIKRNAENKEYISTSALKIKDIKMFEKIEGNEYDCIQLKIMFYDGGEIFFNSSLDTNTHHAYKFKEVINDISKYLIERA